MSNDSEPGLPPRWEAPGPQPPVRAIADARTFGAIATFDAHLRYLTVAGTAWQGWGLDREAVVGRRVDELGDPTSGARLAEMARGAIHGMSSSDRIPWNGGVWDVWAGPLPPGLDGQPRGILMSRDAAEEATPAPRSLVEHVVGAVPVGLTMVDLRAEDRPLIYVSDSFCRLTGYERREILGRNCRFLQGEGTDPEAVAELRRAIDERRATQVELVNYRKSGERFWNRVTLRPVAPEPGGDVTLYVGVQEDVTDLRRLRGERDHARRLSELGLLASGLAHDFNNILTEIGALASLARREPLPGGVTSDLRAIVDATRRGARLVDQLLGSVRTQPDSRRTAEVGTLLEDLVPALRRLVPDSVAVDLHVADGPLRVLLDPVQLEQIVLNLVKNAADAIAEGSGRVEITARRDRTGTSLLLEVEDTGAGMDEETLGRIFDPFFTTKGARGTGLGLSSVQGIAEEAGGDVCVQSTPGAGTCVAVRLPLLETASAPDPEATELQPSTAQPVGPVDGPVLLVDDDPGVRSVLERLLKREGFSVVTAADGLRGLEAFEAAGTAFGAVVTDHAMPGLSGDRLLRHVEQAALRRGSRPVMVLMSGDPSSLPDDLPERVVTLPKPFELDTLASVLHRSAERDAGSLAG